MVKALWRSHLLVSTDNKQYFHNHSSLAAHDRFPLRALGLERFSEDKVARKIYWLSKDIVWKRF